VHVMRARGACGAAVHAALPAGAFELLQLAGALGACLTASALRSLCILCTVQPLEASAARVGRVAVGGSACTAVGRRVVARTRHETVGAEELLVGCGRGCWGGGGGGSGSGGSGGGVGGGGLFDLDMEKGGVRFAGRSDLQHPRLRSRHEQRKEEKRRRSGPHAERAASFVH